MYKIPFLYILMCLMSANVFCQIIEPQLFSVSETKQVVFSKGNLVYNQNTKKYSFYKYQYSGKWLPTRLHKCGTYFSSPSGDLTMLFSWDECQKWRENADKWCILSKEEWEYLIEKRENAKELCFLVSFNTSIIDEHEGVLLFPDNFKLPKDVSLDKFEVTRVGYKKFNLTTETVRLLETYGAVFIPQCGMDTRGCYWTSSIDDDSYGKYAYCLYFDFLNNALGLVSFGKDIDRSNKPFYGVRLVKPACIKKKTINPIKTHRIRHIIKQKSKVKVYNCSFPG